MISYDIFDTCVVRLFARPSDLYLVLAETLLEGKEDHGGRESIAELVRLRAAAAKTALAQSEGEGIRLEDIYRNLELDGWPILRAEMMAEELRLEMESVRPVMQTKLEIDRLRRAGESVAFISDTPLPQQHLYAVLEKWGFAQPGDRIYASSDVGLGKMSGRLFRHVLEAEGLSASELVHRGDHPVADVSSPRRLGIRAEPFLDVRPNRYEQGMLTDGYGRRSIRSRIAGVSRATRLRWETDTAGLPGLAGMVANVVAPLLTCFVAWLLHEARDAGLDRLYFVSRDGEILQRIAEVLARHIPVPELRYLYGSRQAWLLAATTGVSRDELAWIFNDSVTLRDLLGKVGLDPSDVERAFQAHAFDEASMGRELDGEETERFWRVIAQPDVEAVLLERVASSRERALAYFAQEGLTDGSSWALVDVGWKLQSQWALRRLLGSIGSGTSVNGYYLAIARKRRRMAEAGPYRALYLPEEFEEVPALHRHAVLIEEAFLPASHGSVLGYRAENGVVTPVLRDDNFHPDWPAYRLSLEQVVLSYASEAAAAGILDEGEHLEELKRSALRAAHRFLTDPTPDEAETLAWMTASDDPFHHPEQHRPLVEAYGIRHTFGRLVERGLSKWDRLPGRLEMARPHWNEGSMALSKPWISKLYRSVSTSAPWLRRR